MRAIASRWTSPALARAAHLSPAHFSREFTRAFGETPHRYLLTRRMERAADLLRNTDRSVADICLTVGLRSVGSFTTSLRQRRTACPRPPTGRLTRRPSASDPDLRAAGVRPSQRSSVCEKTARWPGTSVARRYNETGGAPC